MATGEPQYNTVSVENVSEDDYNITYFTYTDMVEQCDGSEHSFSLTLFQTFCFVAVFLLGVAGNSLVIATFTKFRNTRLRCMMDVFLLHLALSDLQVLLTLPLQTGETLMGRWPFGAGLCKLTHFLRSVNTYSGLLLLACISAERYVMVVLRSRAAPCRWRAAVRRSWLACAAVVLTSIALSLPDFVFAAVEKEGDSARCVMEVQVELDSRRMKLAMRGAKIVGFCGPFAVMLFCYSAIGYVLVQGQGKGPGWRRQRTLRLMVALVLLFLLFQLPHAVVLSLRVAAYSRTCDAWKSTLTWESVTRTLAYARCCLNPVLYALMGVRFRTDVLRLLQQSGCTCCPRPGPSLETPGSSGTLTSLPTSPQSSKSHITSPYNGRHPPVPGPIRLS
ncbi:C-C chemokine receptor type 10 [Denticeps clupeoides]|uniref:C-C chemokine receptor type 10 n=1 Tax=Denticeps clupeoides TaxID=299321 RepID=UPI0010A4171F|nr:C-C chemokine receptor type 10-like [Denticeps clupeoides]